MWWKMRQWLGQSVAAHAPSYACVVLVMVAGLSAGTATARGLTEGVDPAWALTELSARYAGGWTHFFSALWLTVRFFLLVFIGTLGWGGVLPIVLVTGLRGFFSGFGMGLMVCALGARGWLVTLTALLPCAVVAGIAHTVAAVPALDIALANLRMGFRQRLGQKLSVYADSYLIMLAMALLTLAAAALEAGMVPLLLP